MECGKLKSDLKSHIHRKHKHLKRSMNLAEYRIKSIHQHNLAVVKKKRGELILSRRPSDAFQIRGFGPCPQCHVWMLIANIPVHIKHCKKSTTVTTTIVTETVTTDSQTVTRDYQDTSEVPVSQASVTVKHQSDKLAGRVPLQESTRMTAVFERMKRDDISQVVKNDSLIVAQRSGCFQRRVSVIFPRTRYYFLCQFSFPSTFSP